jgi:hypothetical protein
MFEYVGIWNQEPSESLEKSQKIIHTLFPGSIRSGNVQNFYSLGQSDCLRCNLLRYFIQFFPGKCQIYIF